MAAFPGRRRLAVGLLVRLATAAASFQALCSQFQLTHNVLQVRRHRVQPLHTLSGLLDLSLESLLSVLVILPTLLRPRQCWIRWGRGVGPLDGVCRERWLDAVCRGRRLDNVSRGGYYRGFVHWRDHLTGLLGQSRLGQLRHLSLERRGIHSV